MCWRCRPRFPLSYFWLSRRGVMFWCCRWRLLLTGLAYLALLEVACFGAARSGCCWLFLVEADLEPARRRVLLLPIGLLLPVSEDMDSVRRRRI